MDEMSRFSFNEKTSSQVFLRASILKKITSNQNCEPIGKIRHMRPG